MAAAPAETDSRVADGIALHLVNGHLRSMTLYELDKATTLSRWDLDVSDLTEALEERTKLVLGDVTRKPTDKDSGVIRVRELVHWLWLAIVPHRWIAHLVVHIGSCRSRPASARHATHTTRSSAASLILGCSSRDTHGSIAAVDTLHLL